MKIKLFKKENSFKKKNFVFNPGFYWKIALFGVFATVLFSSFFGHRLFTQINQEPILPTVSEDGQVPTVKKERIEKVLNYFSEREKKSIDILNFSTTIVDPSL